jgi:hypothetical protein
VGLFQRRGKTEGPAAPVEPEATPVPATLLLGEDTLEVEGESLYQENLWRLAGGPTEQHIYQECIAVLVLDDDYPDDEKAISVQIHGLTVGHLPRETARQYRGGLERLMRKYGQHIALESVIAGGEQGEDGLLRLEVSLTHDSSDFL